MTTKCEKCNSRPATVFISEMMDGMILTRDLCEKCAEINSFPEIPPLSWTCRCGKTVKWQYEAADCGHGGAAYVLGGEQEQEVAVCECGIHYVARFPVWRCEICGKTSLFPPRLGGSKGFLRSYLYGSSHAAKVEIKGIVE